VPKLLQSAACDTVQRRKMIDLGAETPMHMTLDEVEAMLVPLIHQHMQVRSWSNEAPCLVDSVLVIGKKIFVTYSMALCVQDHRSVADATQAGALQAADVSGSSAAGLPDLVKLQHMHAQCSCKKHAQSPTKPAGTHILQPAQACTQPCGLVSTTMFALVDYSPDNHTQQQCRSKFCIPHVASICWLPCFGW
jgi:hypothetical protein